ncbi:MAG: TerB family tellurite resistance protein [Rhodospirillales bacterium]|nr:TerB family tellurite resistance protein [Rhodospirillales bacterium]
MVNVLNSPLYVLATCIAYLVNADTRTTFEEKAKLITIFGKHVSRNEMTHAELHGVMTDAFDFASKIDVDRFIAQITPKMPPGQRISIVINLYDAMLVDGQVAAGERVILNKFVGAFDLSRDTMRSIREIMMLKNDTSIFTDDNHPYNEPSYTLDIKLNINDDANGKPQLTDNVAGVKEKWKS